MNPADDGALVIVAACALVGDRLEPLEPAVIVVRDGRISAIGTEVHPAERDDAIRLEECLVLPGFVDSHVHLGFYEPHDVLLGGVTTVRDLGWPPKDIFRLVARSRTDEFPGPRVVAAGPILTAPGGYPARAGWAPAGTAREVADRDDARAAVDAVADRGAIVVKVALNPPAGPTLSRELLRTIVTAAAQRGLKVTAHIHGLVELEKAIECGVAEMAHMLMSDEVIPSTMIGELVERDVSVVPTLGIHAGKTARTSIRNLRSFIEAGGTVLYGTDLGNEGPRPGIDATEIRAMAAAGMSCRQIIEAATTTPRRRLPVDAGALEPGARADLIAVPRQAASSAGALSDVKLVMRGGRIARREPMR